MNEFITRLRNNRKSPWIRDLLAENQLHASDFILPVFIISGENKEEKINNLPSVSRFSIDLAIKQAKLAYELGIKALMLFPVTPQNLKSDDGKEALNRDNLINQAIRAIKSEVPDIGVISDVALDPYTIHGHDGVLDNQNYVDNDKTVKILIEQALIQAESGSDVLAPSDMMDGRIYAIRKSLEQNNYKKASIMSYSAKYASNFYGPFRDAVGSKQNIKSSDKRNYQMDFRNSQEAMREIIQDEKEGADMVIIKPGIFYLDIIKEASQKTNLPIFSYQVSGEYSMLKLAAKEGILDYESALLESLYSLKRAGSRGIITYGAIEAVKILKNNS